MKALLNEKETKDLHRMIGNSVKLLQPSIHSLPKDDTLLDLLHQSQCKLLHELRELKAVLPYDSHSFDDFTLEDFAVKLVGKSKDELEKIRNTMRLTSAQRDVVNKMIELTETQYLKEERSVVQNIYPEYNNRVSLKAFAMDGENIVPSKIRVKVSREKRREKKRKAHEKMRNEFAEAMREFDREQREFRTLRQIAEELDGYSGENPLTEEVVLNAESIEKILQNKDIIEEKSLSDRLSTRLLNDMKKYKRDYFVNTDELEAQLSDLNFLEGKEEQKLNMLGQIRGEFDSLRLAHLKSNDSPKWGRNRKDQEDFKKSKNANNAPCSRFKQKRGTNRKNQESITTNLSKCNSDDFSALIEKFSRKVKNYDNKLNLTQKQNGHAHMYFIRKAF